MLRKIFASRIFKVIKIVFILLVCYTLYLDLPNKELAEREENIKSLLNSITLAFFILKTILKIILHGFVAGKHSYLRRSWLNCLNLLIIAAEVLYLTPLSSSNIMFRFSKVKVLRLLSIIQLRYESSWDMRILIRSLKQLVVKFCQLLMITLVIYFFFALILTKVYQNDGYYCDNAYERATIVTKQDCFNWGGDWVKYKIHFTDVFSSLLSLFFIGTMEGWIYFMKNMMDFNGKDMAPSYNANEHIQIFFVIFFFFGNLIILNSFISLSLITFKKLKEKETGEVYLNETEKMWLRLKSQIV